MISAMSGHSLSLARSAMFSPASTENPKANTASPFRIE